MGRLISFTITLENRGHCEMYLLQTFINSNNTGRTGLWLAILLDRSYFRF